MALNGIQQIYMQNNLDTELNLKQYINTGKSDNLRGINIKTL